MPVESIDLEELERQVASYRAVRPVYQVFTEILIAVLNRAAHELQIAAIVQARAKEIPSFAGKIVRKQHIYPDPINQFTDLCGARVIVGYKFQVEPMVQFIRRIFEIDEANSEDVIRRLGVEKFGYAGVHLIVSVKDRLEFVAEQDQLVKEMVGQAKRDAFLAGFNLLDERRSERECRELKLPPGPKHKAEVQVRTLLQHAWAECAHDRVYKSEYEVPARWQRDINRIAASLEEADESFVRAIHGVESYHTYHGPYLTRPRRMGELSRLEAVMKYDPDDAPLARKAARLAISLEDWRSAELKLASFVDKWDRSAKAGLLKANAKIIEDESRKPAPDQNKVEPAQRALVGLADPPMAGVLLDYGWARWNRGRRERDETAKDSGQEKILWATYLDPSNVDAVVALAETCTDDPEEAVERYQRAFTANHLEPRVLAGLVYYRILVGRTLDFIAPLRPSLESAISICRERIRIGIYLPQAYYNLGLFALVLGRPHQSLPAYAKAMQKDDSETSVHEELGRIEHIQKVLKGKLPEVDWVCRLLCCARVAKLLQAANAAKDNAKAALRECENAERKLKDLKMSDPKKAAQATQDFDSAKKQLQDAESAARDAMEKAEKERAKCLRGITLRAGRFEQPVVIVAGGTDESVERRIREYESMLDKTLAGFSGTVFGGGTRKGISGLVGGLPALAKESVRKIAYVRESLPVWAEPWKKTGQEGYELVCLPGAGFTPLEPIQTWIDLLASGVDPKDVRLIGINGGRIAAFEYRLALAMGARVGILGDSGRAASEIFDDDEWNEAPGLLRLPRDVQAVKVFAQGIPDPTVLDDAHRTALAKRAHEEYCKAQSRPLASTDPALTAWEDLPPGLQDSNRQQVAHIEEKLRAAGLRLRKVDPESLRRVDFAEDRYKDAVEMMAEMEHGRWVVERLMAGWKLGPKDIAKRTSPYLVAWSELTDDIKKFDRDAVLALPVILAELGYEISANGSGDG